ncbi:hypothetical protein SAMN05421847_0194 [Halpernia humi]|uniref:Uncharacterized protein n=1 Tax=Halpernia humi TaxID=493375 RepID=A0A1H5SM74_9FLAO|nr:hypothetical protein SAMN05421847_0194 [Halpernia humi]
MKNLAFLSRNYTQNTLSLVVELAETTIQKQLKGLKYG